MTTLRVEIVGGLLILSCEACGWVGSQTKFRCVICGRKFNRIKIIHQDGKISIIEGSDEKDPNFLC